MNSPDATRRPKLSAILLTRAGYEPIRKTISFLKRQTALELLELVIVAPSRAVLELDEADVAVFPFFQVVEFGKIDSTGPAMAAGVRAARADWVAYTEEHSYAAPRWAEALIAAQSGPWAVIGSAMDNANPDTLTSWAHLMGQFGPVVIPVESGETHYVAGHHSTYRRDLLLPFGEELGPLLDAEVALHLALKAKGHKLYLASDAVCAHVNISRLSPFVLLEYGGQRIFGARRWQSLGWSLPRRLFYAAASPLVAPLRLLRVSKDVWRCRKSRPLIPWVFPIMGIAFLAGAVGEAVGYLFGAGVAPEDKIDFELDRWTYTTEGAEAEQSRDEPASSGG